jgi:hypothetical protein
MAPGMMDLALPIGRKAAGVSHAPDAKVSLTAGTKRASWERSLQCLIPYTNICLCWR